MPVQSMSSSLLARSPLHAWMVTFSLSPVYVENIRVLVEFRSKMSSFWMSSASTDILMITAGLLSALISNDGVVVSLFVVLPEPDRLAACTAAPEATASFTVRRADASIFSLPMSG